VTLSGDNVRIPYSAEHVRAGPEVEAEEIDDDVIRSLAAHYGLDDQMATAVLVAPEPEPPEDDRTRLERALRQHAPVVDPAGERLGELDAVYYDDRTGEPSWLGVRAERAPSGRVLVPTAGASFGKDEVRVAHERALVEASPAAGGERIDARTDRVLRSHFGIDVPPETGLELEWVPVEGDDSGRVETLPDGSVSIPVLEEQVVASTRTIVRERVVVRRRRESQGGRPSNEG